MVIQSYQSHDFMQHGTDAQRLEYFKHIWTLIQFNPGLIRVLNEYN